MDEPVVLRRRVAPGPRRTAALIIAMFVAGAPGLSYSAAPEPAYRDLSDPRPQPQPRLDLEPCGAEGVKSEMLCGRLDVPENYDRPLGRRLSLNVVVVPAAKGPSDAPALFELAGGPGLGVTGLANFYLGPGRAFRESRNIVLVDQRGTGESSPLHCPEIESLSPLEEMYPVEAVRSCRRRLEAAADLTQYTTDNAARDLEQVRAALGYRAVDLQGTSYGTELARAYIRLFPERVRSAVLIGPPPADMRTPLPHAANAQRALDLLFHECQSDVRCRSAHPDLRANWRDVLRRVEAGVRQRRLDPMTGTATEIVITRGPFAEALRNLFTTATARRSLPTLIARAAAGDFTPLVEAMPSGAGGFAEGLYLSVACAEGTSRIEPADVPRFTSGTFLGDYRVRQQMLACAEWPLASVPPRFHEPLASTHPVLLLVGEFDATTPPHYAREVCAALANCRLVQIPGMGHGPFDLDAWSGGECFNRVVLEFLDRGDPKGLDTSCVAGMTPPPFAMDEAVTLEESAVRAILGTYEQGPLRLVIDRLEGRLRARLFQEDTPVGASFLTPVSPARLRLDQIPGRFAEIEDDGGRRTLRLSSGEAFVKVVRPER
jgi:pimeloyl-ACP methyl ester carboxylesterase